MTTSSNTEVSDERLAMIIADNAGVSGQAESGASDVFAIATELQSRRSANTPAGGGWVTTEDDGVSEKHSLALSSLHPADGEPVAWPGRKFCEIAERNTSELAKFIKGEDDRQVVTDAGLAIRTLLASIDRLTRPSNPVSAEVTVTDAMVERLRDELASWLGKYPDYEVAYDALTAVLGGGQ